MRPTSSAGNSGAAPHGSYRFADHQRYFEEWPNKIEITVKGAHFLPEDSPDEVGEAAARFVAKVLAGQTRNGQVGLAA